MKKGTDRFLEEGGKRDDLRDHGALHRHQGPVLCRGLSGRLHLRRRGSVLHKPRGVHRLRRLRAGVPSRGYLPRGRGPRGDGELHRKERRLLRVTTSVAFSSRAEKTPTLFSQKPEAFPVTNFRDFHTSTSFSEQRENYRV